MYNQGVKKRGGGIIIKKKGKSGENVQLILKGKSVKNYKLKRKKERENKHKQQNKKEQREYMILGKGTVILYKKTGLIQGSLDMLIY